MSDHREIFTFLAYCWDVTRAQEIAAHLPVHHADFRPWFGWLAAIRIGEEHLDQADLSRPLILVQIREADGDVMLIDGSHPLARAKKDGTSDLPFVLLDEEQEYEIRLHGGRKNPPNDN